jgi:catechol 2,3-dioxygenase-like lactoylglutathione lyase family enzyme
MSIVGLDHVQLAMPEGGEEAARAFYGQLLGLAEAPKPPHLAARGGCWFQRGSVKVHLGVERPFAPARKAHVAFLVQDLPGLRQRVAEAGVEVQDDQPLEGYDRTYVADPFGNRIELMEPAP